MKLSDYLKEDRILLKLKSTKRDEAIKELGELIREAEEVIDYQAFLKDVFEREKEKTTGIGNGIALPHARTAHVNRFVIVMGRSDKGIQFESLDEKPVKIVLLMGTPKDGLGEYLRMLAHLSRLLNKKSFLELLLKAKDAKEIIAVFKRAEGDQY